MLCVQKLLYIPKEALRHQAATATGLRRDHVHRPSESLPGRPPGDVGATQIPREAGLGFLSCQMASPPANLFSAGEIGVTRAAG